MAPELLGCVVETRVEGVLTSGVIVEVEAYVGPHDPASHAAERIGRTRRNEAMFGPPGRAYVYLIYGIHWCLNVVTAEEGYPAAVLVRGLEPLQGMEVMRSRRGGADALSRGPGRLGQALGITGALDGHDLSTPPLRLRPGWEVEPRDIARSPRIGIRRATDLELRFFIRDNPHVSGARV